MGSLFSLPVRSAKSVLAKEKVNSNYAKVTSPHDSYAKGVGDSNSWIRVEIKRTPGRGV